MKDISQIPEGLLVSQIKNRLEKRFGKLPKEGVVAGQAVASAVYEMLGLTRNAPYNDLDVFCLEMQFPKSIETEIRSQKGGIVKHGKPKKTVLELVGSFGGDPVPSEKMIGGYSILDTVYDPSNHEHNYIKIDTLYSVVGPEDATKHINKVIEGFDINCCQIGIDLETGAISWTPEFKDFLYQKELKTAYFGTPMHTAVRLLKKDDDIDFATIDIPAEMRKIQTIRAIINYYEDLKVEGARFFPGNMMSNIYLRRVQEREDVLSNYFDVIAKSCTFSNMQTGTNEYKDVQRDMYFLESKEYCEDTFNFFTSSIKEDNMYRLDSFIPHFERSYEIFNSPGKKNKQVIDAAKRVANMKGEFYAKNVFIRNAMHETGFSAAGYKDQYIQRYLKMMAKHPRLFHHASYMAMAESMKIAESARWLEKNNMGYVVGELENNLYLYGSDMDMDKIREEKLKSDSKATRASANTLFSLECLLKDDFKSKAKEGHKGKLDSIKDDEIEPRFAEICKKLSHVKKSVKEITNHTDLFYEGENMHHCVGGYWGRVEAGDSYIFHLDMFIDGDVQSSTLELFPGKDRRSNMTASGLQVSQNFGVGNKRPHDDLIDFGEKIRDSINVEIEMVKERIERQGGIDFHSLTKEKFDKYSLFEKLIVVDFDVYYMKSDESFERLLNEKKYPDKFKADELPF